MDGVLNDDDFVEFLGIPSDGIWSLKNGGNGGTSTKSYMVEVWVSVSPVKLQTLTDNHCRPPVMISLKLLL